MPITTVIVFYLAVISLVTAVVTCLDKFFAKKDMWRVSEKALLILAFLGGSLAEYCTMQLIRHKTQHKKFMTGLPFIMLFQLALVFVFLYLKSRGTV